MERSAIKIVLGQHAVAAPLKSGELKLRNASLRFTEFDKTHQSFKLMINDQAFDICEMAIVTLILAKCHGRKLNLLPAMLVGRLQHPIAAVNVDVDMASPIDIAGKRIGVRSFAQTTVTWLRGILQNEYGADLSSAHWVSVEDGHVPEVPDPSERAPAGSNLKSLLIAGEIDIALGVKATDPRMKPLFSDPDAEAQKWFQKYGCLSINHGIAVTNDMLDNDLDAVADFWATLKDSNARLEQKVPMGFDAIAASIELLIQYLNDLGLLPQPMRVEDLIDPRIREIVEG